MVSTRVGTNAVIVTLQPLTSQPRDCTPIGTGWSKHGATFRAALDARIREWYPENVHYQPRLHIVLHQPEIPPNTGAVGRTCVAIAAKLWLVRPLGFRIDEKTRRRAGLDYWESLEWDVADDWASAVASLPDRRPWFFTKTATRCVWDVDFTEGDILVFGSETAGLPPSMLRENPERLVGIPILPPVRSLNLSNAVAIAAYEAIRQFDRPSRAGNRTAVSDDAHASGADRPKTAD